MKETQDEIMQTTPVRIDRDVLGLVRDHKVATGIPIQRFIEDAIMDKIMSTTDEVKAKMKLTPSKFKKATKESNKKKK